MPNAAISTRQKLPALAAFKPSLTVQGDGLLGASGCCRSAGGIIEMAKKPKKGRTEAEASAAGPEQARLPADGKKKLIIIVAAAVLLLGGGGGGGWFFFR